MRKIVNEPRVVLLNGLELGFRKYRFGVITQTDEGSTGHLWIQCVYDYRLGNNVE